MDNTINFHGHMSWLGELASTNIFKREKANFIKRKVHGIEIQINEELGIVEGKHRNQKTGEFEKYTTQFDNHILGVTNYYVDNPITNIIEPISRDDIETQIEAWLSILNYIKKRVNNQSYYSKFPRYKESISKAIEVLQSLKISSPTSSKRSTGKKQKAFELKPDLQTVLDANDHEEAINNLKRKYSEFSWEDKSKKLIFSSNGNINKSQTANALEIIGKLKYPEDYPKAKTIQKYLEPL